jgi:hypothetical protein
MVLAGCPESGASGEGDGYSMRAWTTIPFAGVVVLALAACTQVGSGEAGRPRVPSVPSPTTASSTAESSSAPDTNYDKALRFTRCMNETLDAMYPDATARSRRVPDPVEGKPLQTWVSVPQEVFKAKGGGAAVGGLVSDADGRGWQIVVPEIFDKCKRLLPPIWPVKEDADDQRRFGAFYECLRKRGIDVPRANADGIILSNPNPEARDTEEYKAAENACRHLADDPAVKRGDQ